MPVRTTRSSKILSDFDSHEERHSSCCHACRPSCRNCREKLLSKSRYLISNAESHRPSERGGNYRLHAIYMHRCKSRHSSNQSETLSSQPTHTVRQAWTIVVLPCQTGLKTTIMTDKPNCKGARRLEVQMNFYVIGGSKSPATQTGIMKTEPYFHSCSSVYIVAVGLNAQLCTSSSSSTRQEWKMASSCEVFS